jgi:hypothetical protein
MIICLLLHWIDGPDLTWKWTPKLRSPRHYTLNNEPWTLWINNIKISKDIYTKIYNLIHDEEARSYWINKPEVTYEVFSSVKWEAIQQAMQEVPCTKCLFFSKHVAGMYGIGKVMQRWKLKDDSSCPRCGVVTVVIHQ